ncbi:MAG: DedA family protein [Burkholderiales bacterium]|nr:DedA family protein [Burkholderiales bacterium]
MELLSAGLEFVLHLDRHLLAFAQQHGAWVYALLFLIVFCETGLVVTPFLPGDSLLFVAGTLAGAGAFDAHLLVVLLIAAAICGDSVNWTIGRTLGPRVFRAEKSWFFDRRYIDAARAFYDRHGGKTLVMARFVPIIRTYAPFVAGIGAMPYRRFIAFCIGGAVMWVGVLVYLGYFVGGLPVVQAHLSKVIVLIVLISVAPGVIELVRTRRARARAGH